VGKAQQYQGYTIKKIAVFRNRTYGGKTQSPQTEGGKYCRAQSGDTGQKTGDHRSQTGQFLAHCLHLLSLEFAIN